MNTCNICFYGAVRTLDKTISSIQKNLIEPLSKDYNIKIFATVWEEDDDSLYSNFQAKIKKIKRPKRFSQIKKDAIANTTGNIGGTGTINLIHALYSLKCVTKLLPKIGEKDIVIFIRPDSKFYSVVSADTTKMLKQENQIITPSYDNFFYKTGSGVAAYKNGMGANDRFIICLGKDSTETIGLRYDLIDEYIGKKKGLNNTPIIHPEGFLEWVIKKNNIINHKVSICLTLLRENGDELGECKGKKKTRRKIPK